MEKSALVAMKSDCRRLDWIDLLKAIAITVVVFLHGYFLPTNFVVDGTLSSIAGYALRIFMVAGVPLFVIVNGYLLFRKENFCLKKHYGKVMKILFLIFAWCVIYQVLSNIIYGTPFSLSKLIHGCLFSVAEHDGLNNAIGVLWFLRSLVAVYLLFPIIKYVFDHQRRLYWYLLVVVAFFSVGLNLVQLLCGPISAATGSDINVAINMFIESFNPFSITTFLMFFLVGGGLHLMESRMSDSTCRKRVAIVLFITVLCSLAYGFSINVITPEAISLDFLYPTIMMLIITVALFIMLYGLEVKSGFGRAICSIGQNCFGIYFIHLIFLHIFARMGLYDLLESLSSGGIMIWVVSLFINLAILFLSYICTRLLRRIPFLRCLVGL